MSSMNSTLFDHYAEKIAIAKKAREQAKILRKGKQVSFRPALNSFTPRNKA